MRVQRIDADRNISNNQALLRLIKHWGKFKVFKELTNNSTVIFRILDRDSGVSRIDIHLEPHEYDEFKDLIWHNAGEVKELYRWLYHLIERHIAERTVDAL